MGLRKASTIDPLREVVYREHRRDTAGLLEQLRGGDVEQRRWAARDLATHPEASATLGEHLLRESAPSVREAVFTSLATLADEGAVLALLPLLRSEDAVLRNGAIEALAGMPQAVAPRITGLLRDADVDVRLLTVNLLGNLRHEQVPAWLLQVLQHEAEVNVVAAAIEALAEVGGPADTDALRQAKRRFADDPFIHFAADVAIERIEAP